MWSFAHGLLLFHHIVSHRGRVLGTIDTATAHPHILGELVNRALIQTFVVDVDLGLASHGRRPFQFTMVDIVILCVFQLDVHIKYVYNVLIV